MANNLAKVLKADIPRLPLRRAAEELRKKGRGRDTILAHITPREAAMLKSRGGSGTINPETGLPEFDDFVDMAFSQPTYDYTPSPMQSDTFQGSFSTTPYGSTAEAENLQKDYLSQVASNEAAPGQTLWEGGGTPQEYISNLQAAEKSGAIPALGAYGQYGTPNNFLAFSGTPLGTTPTTYASAAPPSLQAANILANAGTTAPDQTLGGTADRQYSTPEGIDKETMDRMNAADAQKTAAAKGIQTPFGTLGTKELIAALGLGGLGLSYMNAQNQGKKAAQQLQGAYNQASAQDMALAQPYMQQGGSQLAQALTGALSPAQQQQLAAGQAAAAQSTASSGGVAAAQAGRSVEDLRQRLLSNQQTMALQLLGAGTPLIGQAIQNQLSGTTTGINTQMAMSQQAGQAAAAMVGMLTAMYGRSA